MNEQSKNEKKENLDLKNKTTLSKQKSHRIKMCRKRLKMPKIC